MRHFSAIILIFVIGCATAPGDRGAGFSWWKSPAAKEAQVAEKDEKAAETSSSNPFQKVETAKADAPKTDAEKPAEMPADETKDPSVVGTTAQVVAPEKSDPPAAATFSAETLRLIDAELADATPQERSFWYEQLKRVDAAVIPQILQARRLTADVVEQQRQNSSTAIRFSDEAAESGRPFPVMPASGEELPDSPGRTGETLRQAEGGAGREFIAPTRFEPDPSASPSVASPQATPPQPSYAVRRTAAAESSSQSPPAPNSLSTRNALSRLLPTRTGAQSSANSPSAVSLLPPTEIEQVSATRPQLESLISQVEGEIAQLQLGAGEEEEVEYIRRHVYLRMLYLMARQPERALTAIPGIDPADQEFWQQTLWAMANYFDTEHIASTKDRAGQAVTQLTMATQRLKERADLAIRNLAFCREIAYFGNFTRFNRDEFRPGDSALLYAEIDNFKSELTIDGQYRTLLRSTIEILSPSGEVRWQKEFAATEDLCINYRRDYFHNYQFNIDDRLPLGPHTLKLTVFDELSGKMVSQSINFVVR